MNSFLPWIIAALELPKKNSFRGNYSRKYGMYVYININNNICDHYSRAETNQGRKLLNIRRFLLRKLFKGGNYSREETIRGNTVFKPEVLSIFFSNFFNIKMFEQLIFTSHLRNLFPKVCGKQKVLWTTLFFVKKKKIAPMIKFWKKNDHYNEN